MADGTSHKLVLIGCSAGGLEALKTVLGGLSLDMTTPIVIVQHMGNQSEGLLIDVLSSVLCLKIREAIEGMIPVGGYIYVAPGGYHLLFERDGRFSLSLDPPQMGSRPSLDVTFESAAISYGPDLMTVVLSGNNHDGSGGVKKVLKLGGIVVVQDPKQAKYSIMPAAAVNAVQDVPKGLVLVANTENITEIILDFSSDV